MPILSFIRRKRAARRLWREFAPLAHERITLEDAENVGYSSDWFREVLAEKVGSGDAVLIGKLGFAMGDEEVVDLLRYKREVLRLREALATVLSHRFSPYDAVAAGVVSRNFLDVCRMLYPEAQEICLGDLVAHIRRPVVSEFFGTGEMAAIRSRIDRIVEAAADRQDRMAAASFALDREVNLRDAEMSGASRPGTRSLAEIWFGKGATLNVETLLLVPQVEDFARLAQWRVMMAAA